MKLSLFLVQLVAVCAALNHWNFEAGYVSTDGFSYYDQSGNAGLHHSNCSANLPCNLATNYYTTGVVGRAFSVNSTINAFVTSASGTADFTITFWIQLLSAGPNPQWWYDGLRLLWGELPGHTTDFGMVVMNGQVVYGWGNSINTNPGEEQLISQNVNDGNWHFVGATRKTYPTYVICTLYVDGRLFVFNSTDTNPRTSTNLAMGGSSSGSYPFNIDEVRYDYTAYSVAELTTIYMNEANYATPVAYFNFESNTLNNGYFNDISGVLGAQAFVDTCYYGGVLQACNIAADYNTTGKVGASALNFNYNSGANNFLNSTFPVQAGITEYSLALWVKTSTTGPAVTDWRSGFPIVVGKNLDFGLTVVNNKFAFGWLEGSSAVSVQSTSSGSLTDGNWHFVWVTKSVTFNANSVTYGSVFTISVDGTVNSATSTYNPAVASSVAVLGSVNGIYFNGAVDELRWYDRPVAANLFTIVQNNDLGYIPTPLGAWTFEPNTFSGTSTYLDVSGHNINFNSACYNPSFTICTNFTTNFNTVGYKATSTAMNYGNSSGQFLKSDFNLGPRIKSITHIFWLRTPYPGTASTNWYRGVPIGFNDQSGTQSDSAIIIMNLNGVNNVAYGWGDMSPGNYHDTYLNNPYNISDNAWHFISAVRKVVGDTVTYSLAIDNATPVTATTHDLSDRINNDMYIGLDSESIMFLGQIDDYRVFDYPLSAAQITFLYNSDLGINVGITSSAITSGGLTTAALTTSPYVDPAPTKWWSFETNTIVGTNFVDSNQQVFNSTCHPTGGTCNIATNYLTDGKVGTNALKFSFNSASPTYYLDSAFSVPSQVNTFSVIFWLKSNEVAPNTTNWYLGLPVIVADASGIQSDWGIQLVRNQNPLYANINATVVAFGYGDISPPAKDVTLFSTNTINVGDGFWHFVCASRLVTPGVSTLYTVWVDGVSTTSLSSDTSARIITPVQVGSTGTASHSNVAIDELRWYQNVAIRDQYVQATYNNEKLQGLTTQGVSTGGVTSSKLTTVSVSTGAASSSVVTTGVEVNNESGASVLTFGVLLVVAIILIV